MPAESRDHIVRAAGNIHVNTGHLMLVAHGRIFECLGLKTAAGGNPTVDTRLQVEILIAREDGGAADSHAAGDQ